MLPEIQPKLKTVFSSVENGQSIGGTLVNGMTGDRIILPSPQLGDHYTVLS